MRYPPFALERYFARHEFSVRHMLCASDVEAMPMRDLLAMADEETAALWQSLRLGYTEPAGHSQLRAEIASLYRGIGPDAVLTFAGAEEGIFCAVHALLSRGDHAIVVAPAYQSLFDIARAIGADVSLVPLEPSTWSLDVGLIEAATRDTTRLVVVNYPHSPTGAQLPRDAFDRLVGWCESRGIHLLSDEVYRFLEQDPVLRLPAAVELGERTITLGVLSKAFGLAGLRVGWIATRDTSLLARLMTLKDYTTICNSAPSEVLALMALRAREALIERGRTIIGRNLPRLDAFFERQRERFAWVRPQAGTVGFPRLVRGGANRFADRLIKEAGVLVLPGSLFGYDPAHFRIGFGRVDLPAALDRLEEFAVHSISV